MIKREDESSNTIIGLAKAVEKIESTPSGTTSNLFEIVESQNQVW